MVSLLADDTSYIIYVYSPGTKEKVFFSCRKKNVKNQNKLFQV